MEPVTQLHVNGSGIACIASLLGMSYEEAMLLFERHDNIFTDDMMKVLKKLKKGYRYHRPTSPRVRNTINEVGVIVYVGLSQTNIRPAFFLRTEKGWMDPWLNFPLKNELGFNTTTEELPTLITKAESGFRAELPEIENILAFIPNSVFKKLRKRNK